MLIGDSGVGKSCLLLRFAVRRCSCSGGACCAGGRLPPSLASGTCCRPARHSFAASSHYRRSIARGVVGCGRAVQPPWGVASHGRGDGGAVVPPSAPSRAWPSCVARDALPSTMWSTALVAAGGSARGCRAARDAASGRGCAGRCVHRELHQHHRRRLCEHASRRPLRCSRGTRLHAGIHRPWRVLPCGGDCSAFAQ